MLFKLPQKFSITPIVDQVNSLSFDKRIDLNSPTGQFFNDPWKTLPEFESTPIGEVLNSIGSVGQARLLKLESAQSYTAHSDPDDRMHLAIVTNPYSFLVDIDEQKLYHLPVDGQLWYMDTGKIHVASNWGARTRIHLNVRVLLPKLDAAKPVMKIKIIDGDYDWKQIAYTPIMSIINKGIKDNKITGFKAIDEKHVHLNTLEPDVFKTAIEKIRETGVIIDYQYCI
jgi:hypothetical protein